MSSKAGCSSVPLLLAVFAAIFAISGAQPPRPNGPVDSFALIPVQPAKTETAVPSPLPMAGPVSPIPTPSEVVSSPEPVGELRQLRIPLKKSRMQPENAGVHAGRAPEELGYNVNRQSTDCSQLTCRNLDGNCTSTSNEFLGAARFAQFSYFEGSSSLVPAGGGLKSAREISNILSVQVANTNNRQGLNELFTFFGQFLDHNLVATPAQDAEWPIENPDDPENPLPFRRSTRAMVQGGGGAMRPENTLPSAVDLVAVYGPTKARNEALLEFDENGVKTGKLKTSGDNLLPLNAADPDDAVVNSPNASDDFFIAGDHRANEHPALTAIHTLFLREHNRLVDEIKAKIPFLTGEQLYDFARKLNIAQFQKIVYEEFIPAIIRRRLPRYRGFNPSVNPTVSDVFAGAAFRVGHTLVGDTLKFRTAGGAQTELQLADVFFRPASTFDSSVLDDIIRGTAANSAQEVDLQVVDGLRNLLFAQVPEEAGNFDLISLNLQRGRDHNLPTFNQIRTEICGLRAVRSFRQISRDRKTVQDFIKAYDTVDEVEAWPGLVGERQLRRSGVGRTMACLWLREFQRIRDGDQFFFRRRNVLPDLLRKRCRETVRDLLSRREKLFRKIIIRNTDITDAQLPRTSNIFKFR